MGGVGRVAGRAVKGKGNHRKGHGTRRRPQRLGPRHAWTTPTAANGGVAGPGLRPESCRRAQTMACIWANRSDGVFS